MLSEVIEQIEQTCRLEGRRTDALRMLRKGYPPEDVIRITERSWEDLSEFRNPPSDDTESVKTGNERKRYSAELQSLRDTMIGLINEVEDRGRKNGRATDALRMIREGFPLEEITEITELSQNEIDTIRREHQIMKKDATS